jgi:hypothetical protein
LNIDKTLAFASPCHLVYLFLTCSKAAECANSSAEGGATENGVRWGLWSTMMPLLCCCCRCIGNVFLPQTSKFLLALHSPLRLFCRGSYVDRERSVDVVSQERRKQRSESKEGLPRANRLSLLHSLRRRRKK